MKVKRQAKSFSCELTSGTQEVKLRKSQPDGEEEEDTLKTTLEVHPRREEEILYQGSKINLWPTVVNLVNLIHHASEKYV